MSTDVVVAGGGILGACAALHLAEAGADQVVLLGREPSLGTQTTAAGAGFVGYWAGALEGELAAYAMEFYGRLQDEEGDLGIRQVGLLFPALSEAGVEMLRQEEEREREFADVHMLDADETCMLAPLMAREAVAGGLFQPDGRQVPTGRIMEALGKRLRRVGVDVRSNTRALWAKVSNGRVVSVETSGGSIATGGFVNAAGAAARMLGAANDVDIAAVPLLESRVITAPLEEASDEQPMLLFFERDLFYLRTEAGGLLLGAIERERAARPPASNRRASQPRGRRTRAPRSLACRRDSSPRPSARA